MYTIQTLNKISPLGLNQLDEKEFTVTDTCENPPQSPAPAPT